MNNPFIQAAIAGKQRYRKYGRKVLVGQLTTRNKDELGVPFGTTDHSALANYQLSRKYPHSSTKQMRREMKRMDKNHA